MILNVLEKVVIVFIDLEMINTLEVTVIDLDPRVQDQEDVIHQEVVLDILLLVEVIDTHQAVVEQEEEIGMIVP